MKPKTRIPRAPRPFVAEALALVVVVLMVLALVPVRAASASPLLETTMQAVFAVHSADDSDRFLGSAFLWGEDGALAVTNAHVVQDAAEVRLVDAAGGQEIARVIARDPLRDVAVLAVRPGRPGLMPVTQAPALGAEVWALGAPLGVEFTVTKGMISAQARQVDEAAPMRLVQHDAAVNPGSSGGPLVDGDGRLVGMNSQIADGSRMFVGIAYAITAEDLTRLVPALVDDVLPPLPKLGVNLRPLDRRLAAALKVTAGGLLVDDVEADGLAAESGLRPGDILLSLGGAALDKTGDLAFALEAAQARGDTADLSILRGGEPVVLTLSLEPASVAGVLALRDLSAAAPKKVASYTLAGLGISLDDAGRIVALTDNSPALLAGLALGDTVVQINGQALAGNDLAGKAFDGAVLFLVTQADTARHVLVDPNAESNGFRPVGGANVLDPAVVVF